MSARLLAFLLVAVWSVGPVGAQSGPAVETFDLVLVGDHLRAEAHRVALKTNPTTGASWTVLEETRCPRTNQLLVLSDLSATRYLGQDIRENHLTLRITTPSSTEDARGALRAVYAVPSTEPIDTAACAQLARLARTTPQALRRHSLAIYERPRPASLRAGTPFLDHVEAAVRHRKPGVVEVEWLNVLFGKEE
jgi:hypothetical protein